VNDESQRPLAQFAKLGELVATVLHELRDPLGVIESSLYIIRQNPDDRPRRDKHLQRIDEQVRRAQLVISGLLGLMHDHPLECEPVVLGSLVVEASSTMELRVPLRVELESAPEVRGVRTLLVQALHNLVDNAQRAASSCVSVRAERRADLVALIVEDDGPGVPAAIVDRLFQPLSTGRADGTGLGLALARRIAERHGGALHYERSARTRFVLELPAT